MRHVQRACQEQIGEWLAEARRILQQGSGKIADLWPSNLHYTPSLQKNQFPEEAWGPEDMRRLLVIIGL